MHVHVAFTPEEEAAARVGIVVDVIRATSSIAQALASGYERVLCCAEIDEAQALRAQLGDEAVVGGERNAVVVEGFDVGASPREFAGAPKARALILTTTNGTRAILTAAARCEIVLLGSLLNLSRARARSARGGRRRGDSLLGLQGRVRARRRVLRRRIVESSTASAATPRSRAEVISTAWPDALAGLNARTYGPPGLEADIEFCAQVDLLDVVPRFSRMVGTAAEIRSIR